MKLYVSVDDWLMERTSNPQKDAKGSWFRWCRTYLFIQQRQSYYFSQNHWNGASLCFFRHHPHLQNKGNSISCPRFEGSKKRNKNSASEKRAFSPVSPCSFKVLLGDSILLELEPDSACQKRTRAPALIGRWSRTLSRSSMPFKDSGTFTSNPSPSSDCISSKASQSPKCPVLSIQVGSLPLLVSGGLWHVVACVSLVGKNLTNINC